MLRRYKAENTFFCLPILTGFRNFNRSATIFANVSLSLFFEIQYFWVCKTVVLKKGLMAGYFLVSSTYSKISAGWQSRALHMASNVLKRMALAFPVLRMDRLESVNSTFSESSFSDIFRFAIITSRFTMIGIIKQLNRFRFEFLLPF